MDVLRRNWLKVAVPAIACLCSSSVGCNMSRAKRQQASAEEGREDQWIWLTVRGAELSEIGVLCRQRWLFGGVDEVIKNGFLFRSAAESTPWINSFAPEIASISTSEVDQARQRVVDLGVDGTFSHMIPLGWRPGDAGNRLPMPPPSPSARIDGLFGVDYLQSIELLVGSSTMIMCQWLEGMTWRQRFQTARVLHSADDVLWRSSVQRLSQLRVVEGTAAEVGSPLVPLCARSLQRIEWLSLQRITFKPLMIQDRFLVSPR